ncbi:MAG TPA: pyrroloquinoline quinone biosynthesis protein PqqB [Gemmatimonadaceae bacterium]|nr:pyrroloquinoline quinone biosynthesis protein PqqB [Gemmatimonadaceae bacterium]
MHLILLGSAAGGGFPQWNCWCPTCRVARTEPARARARTQSSLAVSADGTHWFLCNASPDVREQLAALPVATPDAMRAVPVDGVITTDAELDHTMGIVLLREARTLDLYATRAVHETLECDSRLLPVTRAFADVTVHELPLDACVDLVTRDGQTTGLVVESFAVPGDAPRFAQRERLGHTIGLTIRDTTTDVTCAFVPGCGALDDALLARLARADVVLFDGTFFTNNEMPTLGLSDRTARAMGHVPISGDDGSLARLAELPCRERVYTHINNTNPILIDDSPQRAAVEAAGVRVGEDGMRIEL